jgi:small subunit ribosomal protein S20
MANHKSSKKRIRSTETKKTQNRYQARTVRNAIKNLRAATDKEEVVKSVPGVISNLDKLTKKSVIHRNKAANLKSKMMKKANAMEKVVPESSEAEKS